MPRRRDHGDLDRQQHGHAGGLDLQYRSGNTLYVSRDQNPPGSGSQNFTNISSLTGPGGGLPTLGRPG